MGLLLELLRVTGRWRPTVPSGLGALVYIRAREHYTPNIYEAGVPHYTGFGACSEFFRSHDLLD